MWSCTVEPIKPPREVSVAGAGTDIYRAVGRFALEGLAEPLGLAIGLRGVGTGADVADAARAAITPKQPFFPTCYGSEFVSRDLNLWAYANVVTLDFSRPGKPMDNGFIEAFNSKLRAE